MSKATLIIGGVGALPSLLFLVGTAVGGLSIIGAIPIIATAAPLDLLDKFRPLALVLMPIATAGMALGLKGAYRGNAASLWGVILNFAVLWNCLVYVIMQLWFDAQVSGMLLEQYYNR